VEDVRAHVAGLGEPRLRFHAQARNEGEYGQGRYFFHCAQEAGCDYFVILHDDDVFEPDFLKRAVAALDAHAEATFFACNPTIIDDEGGPRDDFTRSFDKRWGRVGVAEGFIDVLDTHMRWGFTPISCAFFRVASLRRSGFVDPDLGGCFPFESNVFVRLGEQGAKAWFTPDRLFRLRWHRQQMINWGFLNDEGIVDSTIRLFERRRFSGDNEARRRRLLGRLYRVRALHRARAGDTPGARRAAADALRANPGSVKSWLVAPLAYAAPGLVGAGVRRFFAPGTFSSV